MLGIDVLFGSRVKGIHTAVQIHVMDKLVHVLVPADVQLGPQGGKELQSSQIQLFSTGYEGFVIAWGIGSSNVDLIAGARSIDALCLQQQSLGSPGERV